MTLGVGLGEPASTEFEFMGEDSDPKIRAEKLDEALRIITGLWTGKPFSFNGKHFKVREATFLPQPTQKPRIPIWVGGYWPNKPPFCRAAKYDGVFPIAEDRISPEELRKVIKFVKTHRRSELHSK
jgi:alkanesulfonate monooxygenase SsuD/methylene tetrahydromethanopterin reductase-like flavin-dependent oxidoreductase (luciferase family)